jgi:23S rRNA pseudouridine1911/1915/1917 synthase
VELRADRKERLDVFLARALPDQSRARLAEHVRQGKVLVEGQPRKPSYRLEPGERVTIEPVEDRPPQALEPVPIELEILYEDDDLIVLAKPPGLSVHPSPTSNAPTLVHGLLAHSRELSRVGGEFRPGIVHRLDKDTSGALLVAKKDSVHHRLQAQIQSRVAKRTYWAWVRGVPKEERFTVRTWLGRHPKNRKKRAVLEPGAPDAREAITHVRTVTTFARAALLECELETGRTHQIRVHLAYVGLPILGDSTYGVPHPAIARQALHAVRIQFEHPTDGRVLAFEAPLPADVRHLQEQLASEA